MRRRMIDMPAHRAVTLSESVRDFEEIVWPTIRHFAGGGEIFSLENIADDQFRRFLDNSAGIDALQVIEGKPLRAIASRVQWPKYSYDTFTSRRSRSSGNETETEKRIAALADPRCGWLGPGITIQAYVHKGKPGEPRSLISAAMVSTEDLYAYLCGQSTEVDVKHLTRLGWAEQKFRDHCGAQDAVWINKTHDKDGSVAWFYAIDWHWMRKAGVPVRIWTQDGEIGVDDPGWRYR